MEAAIALAEELSFSRAAQKPHITQPALTKRIAELEDRFGISLLPGITRWLTSMTQVKLSLKRLAYQNCTARERFKLRKGPRGVLTLSSTLAGLLTPTRFWSQRCCPFNCHCSRDCEWTSLASSRVI